MTPTYRFATGAVLTDAVPVGFRALRRTADVGPAEVFERQGAAVLDWAVQRRSGIAVRDPSSRDARRVEEGLEARVAIPLLRLGAVRLEVAAPVRVVRVLDGPDAIGFVYGTLRGHPEVGEESFVVRRERGRCVLELRALSRPAFPYSLAPLVGRTFQARYTTRYLEALAVPL
ncbi:DUF1990 family protein [Amnibacterium endophyticum]|uniref:DUF1990 family protein n=1 Tax=Amnibacterium endophyticum TaxID=2109337 RepID=A0ABW4LG11_9MICO